MIIVSVSVKKELKSSTNLILVGMAVADCLNSVTIVFHGVSDIDAMLYVMFLNNNYLVIWKIMS